jgi:hypothetical protein
MGQELPGAQFGHTWVDINPLSQMNSKQWSRTIDKYHNFMGIQISEHRHCTWRPVAKSVLNGSTIDRGHFYHTAGVCEWSHGRWQHHISLANGPGQGHRTAVIYAGRHVPFNIRYMQGRQNSRQVSSLHFLHKSMACSMRWPS